MPTGDQAMTAGGHASPPAGQAAQGGAHTQPVFNDSFGFVGLVLAGLYLVGMGGWAWFRGSWNFGVRHSATAAVMLLLVVLYLLARGGFAYNGHNWNRSFADASIVLYSATLAIGPLARLWRPASRALDWRRETGIWATIAAVLHVGIFWEWSLGWEWRPFFYPGDEGNVADSLLGDRALGLRPEVFHLANVVGLVALVYAIVLSLTSNDVSQRWLRGGWSWLMKRSNTMWLLVLLHTWAFAYYITHEQALPLGVLWASFWAVVLLQTAAFTKTVWLRRVARAPGQAGIPASL